MAEMNGPNALTIAIMGGLTQTFMIYHCYRYDGCRCLVPKKKDWFRVMLLWMLLLSCASFLIWSIGWAYVKYQLGWVVINGIGARPWPSMLFPPPFDQFNAPLTVVLGICYAFQCSLNAEEGLYWYHLMRAVRTPHTAKSWLGSHFFYAWIVISVLCTVILLAVPWIGHTSDLQAQLSRELLASGILELGVVASASIVVFKFPRFLEDVKASGAGPEVRSRLHYYHEANKVRTFFRFTFTAPLLILGPDGLTKQALVNLCPPATDFLTAVVAGSICIVMVISIMLYLPRSYGSAQSRVMVGQVPHQPQQALHAASGFALMSLLREGGQWDDDDDLRLGGADGAGAGGARNDAPFAQSEARGTKWSLNDKEEKWHGEHNVPTLLENFTSPIDMPTGEPVQNRPMEIRIRVEREVRAD